MKKFKPMKIIPRILVYGLLVVFIVTAYTAQNETVIYYPSETNETLYNPYMGWAPRATGGAYRIPHRLVYADLTWDEIEPEQEDYQFDEFEKLNKFDYWTGKETKFILRLVLDKPKHRPQMDIPKWLYKAIKKDGTWYKNDYGEGFSPNYRNPVLILYHQKLIEQLAKRYNRDPRIAFIELGSVGHWGEWHTNVNDEKNPFPRYEEAEKYISPYVKNFTEKFLLARRPMPIVMEQNLGLYNDMFGQKDASTEYIKWIDHGYKLSLTNESMPKMPDFWKNAPSGGEFAHSESMRYLQTANIDITFDLARHTHISWVGPNCPPAKSRIKEEVQNNADALMKIIGYRFVIQKEEHSQNAKPGESTRVSVQWLNKGVAPFYFNWEVGLALADETGRIVASNATGQTVRRLLPGITEQSLTLQVPKSLGPGTYILCIGIIDPETQKPGIKLAINGRRDDGYYSLGKITVIP